MKVSIRDLFWLVLVAACLCGWYASHLAWSKAYEALAESASESKGLADRLDWRLGMLIRSLADDGVIITFRDQERIMETRYRWDDSDRWDDSAKEP